MLQLEDVNRGPAISNGGQGSFRTFEMGGRGGQYSPLDIDIEYDPIYRGVPSDKVPIAVTVRAFDVNANASIVPLQFINR